MAQDPDPKRLFGIRLRELRLRADFSQEELAARAGLDRTYVSGVERGIRNISLTNIWKLATALGISPALFFRDVQK